MLEGAAEDEEVSDVVSRWKQIDLAGAREREQEVIRMLRDKKD